MKTFPLVISCPGGEMLRNSVVKIKIRGAEGDLAVMAGHAPFVTSVKPCDCVITLADGAVKTGRTDGGILTVSKDKVTLIVGTFTWL